MSLYPKDNGWYLFSPTREVAKSMNISFQDLEFLQIKIDPKLQKHINNDEKIYDVRKLLQMEQKEFIAALFHKVQAVIENIILIDVKTVFSLIQDMFLMKSIDDLYLGNHPYFTVQSTFSNDSPNGLTCKLTQIFWEDFEKKIHNLFPKLQEKGRRKKIHLDSRVDEVDSYNYWVELFTTIQTSLQEKQESECNQLNRSIKEYEQQIHRLNHQIVDFEQELSNFNEKKIIEHPKYKQRLKEIDTLTSSNLHEEDFYKSRIEELHQQNKLLADEIKEEVTIIKKKVSNTKRKLTLAKNKMKDCNDKLLIAESQRNTFILTHYNKRPLYVDDRHPNLKFDIMLYGIWGSNLSYHIPARDVYERDIWDDLTKIFTIHEQLSYTDVIECLSSFFSSSPPMKTKQKYLFLEGFDLSQPRLLNHLDIEFISMYQELRRCLRQENILQLLDGQYYLRVNRHLNCQILTRKNIDSLPDDVALFHPSPRNHSFIYYEGTKLYIPSGIYIITEEFIFELHFFKNVFPTE